MKAIILSAGQGGRLLPLTETQPKCLLSIGAYSIVEHQIRALHACGISEIVVVCGFSTAAVERAVAELNFAQLDIRCVFNPFYNVADNLASCWMARHEMTNDFVLLNGDTLFEPAVCTRLLNAPAAPVTLAIDHKIDYDSDDMKVRLAGTRLLEVSKTIEAHNIDGESIGMSRFIDQGPDLFSNTLEQVMRTPNSLSWWYLKAIGILADRDVVETASIAGLRWAEVDYLKDLEAARMQFGNGGEVIPISGATQHSSR